MYNKQFFLENVMVHYGSVYKRVRYLTNRNVAEDITQNSMEKAWKNIHQLKDPEKAKAWVFAIALNEIKQYYKYQTRTKELIEGGELEVIDEGLLYEDVLQTLIDSESNEQLIHYIDKLDYKYRSVVKLRYYGEMNISEISDILEMNSNTVRVYIHRALKKIKSNYSEDDIQ